MLHLSFNVCLSPQEIFRNNLLQRDVSLEKEKRLPAVFELEIFGDSEETKCFTRYMGTASTVLNLERQCQ